jgi:hypothetical protein
MRKVKYVGQIDGIIVLLPDAPVEVNYGDVIEVPDNFSNANFEDVVEVVEEKQTKTSK